MSSKTLPERMREAADTLEEATIPMSWGESSPWRPNELREIADKLEAKERAGTVRVCDVGREVCVYVELPDGGQVAVYVGEAYTKGYFVQPLISLPPGPAEIVWKR